MAPRKQGASWAVRSGMRVGAAGIVSELRGVWLAEQGYCLENFRGAWRYVAGRVAND